MIHEMDKAVDEYRKVMDAMRNDEPCTWEEFHAAEDKCERMNWYLENMGYNYWKGQSI